jgi:hypothetical protein
VEDQIRNLFHNSFANKQQGVSARADLISVVDSVSVEGESGDGWRNCAVSNSQKWLVDLGHSWSGIHGWCSVDLGDCWGSVGGNGWSRGVAFYNRCWGSVGVMGDWCSGVCVMSDWSSVSVVGNWCWSGIHGWCSVDLSDCWSGIGGNSWCGVMVGNWSSCGVGVVRVLDWSGDRGSDWCGIVNWCWLSIGDWRWLSIGDWGSLSVNWGGHCSWVRVGGVVGHTDIVGANAGEGRVDSLGLLGD